MNEPQMKDWKALQDEVRECAIDVGVVRGFADVEEISGAEVELQAALIAQTTWVVAHFREEEKFESFGSGWGAAAGVRHAQEVIKKREDAQDRGTVSDE